VCGVAGAVSARLIFGDKNTRGIAKEKKPTASMSAVRSLDIVNVSLVYKDVGVDE
jgi:hypothetical protein